MALCFIVYVGVKMIFDAMKDSFLFSGGRSKYFRLRFKWESAGTRGMFPLFAGARRDFVRDRLLR